MRRTSSRDGPGNAGGSGDKGSIADNGDEKVMVTIQGYPFISPIKPSKGAPIISLMVPSLQWACGAGGLSLHPSITTNCELCCRAMYT